MAGHIFLDIDGTITDDDHHIQDEVALFLKELVLKGWDVSLITGRMFAFAMRTLDKLEFPFFLGVCNGADILSMPAKKVVGRSYLLKEVVADFHKFEVPYTVDAGFDRGDFSYYPPKFFNEEMARYIDIRKRFAPIEWLEFDKVDDIEQEAFPSIKAFGYKDQLEYLESQILKKHSVQTAVLADPIDPRLSILMVNALDAGKGDSVRRIKELVPKEGPTICAGNDMNDVTLLEAGDIGIAVGSPPDALAKVADFIASPSNECGIIPALRRFIDG